MVCPCSTLLALNPLPTPVDERFFQEKGAKGSDLLSDLINHNALMGAFPLVTPNDTELIFAMNPVNEQEVNKSQEQQEPQGAGAQQMQPLTDLSLPPMSREQIVEIIRKLNSGLPEDSITALLNNIPETPPSDNLTIAGMIKQVEATLQVDVDQSQNAILETLSHIQSTESPVDPNNSQHQQSLAYLMLAYYAAINSSDASSQGAHVFFNSFLLHAAYMAGIPRLHLQKDGLLGEDGPIKDQDVLKENVAKSSLVFSGLKFLATERIKFLQQLEDSLESEQSNTSAEALLRDAAKLLNDGIDRNGISIYKRQQITAERMLALIKEYGENEPELVAWNNQFLNLIDLLGLMLDPFASEYVDLNAHIVKIEDYFRKSGKGTTFYNYMDKKRKLLKEIKKLIADAMRDHENQEHKSFLKLLGHLKSYIAQQLHVAFPDKNDYQVIQVTLGTGFRALRDQSYDLLLVLYDITTGSDVVEQADEVTHVEAVKEQQEKELGKEEKKKKHLQRRLNYLNEFVQWLDWFFRRRVCVPDHCYDSDSESDDTRSYSDGSDSEGDDVDTPEGVTQ